MKVALLVSICLAIAAPLQALHAAPTCAVTGSPVLDFGTVNPSAGGNITSMVTLNWTCSRTTNDRSRNNTLCIYLASDNTGSMQPRYLQPVNGQPPNLPFNVYDAPTYTNVVGQPGGPVTNGIEVNVDLNPPTSTTSGTVTLYGMIPTPLPANTQSGLHQAIMANSYVGVLTGGFNQSCDSVTPLITSSYTLTAQATINYQCDVSASDLDFGTQPAPLRNDVDAMSTVTVHCTDTTPFDVGLDNGTHGSRNMANGANLLHYDLYQDNGRNIVWGNSSGSRVTGVGLGLGTAVDLPVYGRVFSNQSAPAGLYTDTITVDVNF
ncbi:MAG: spore coat U domain-containing protein [Alcanivorax sp.]|nr:spore coat U domain-containing protein [Alcanivorax sp.]